MATEHIRQPQYEPEPPAPSMPSAVPVASGPVSKVNVIQLFACICYRVVFRCTSAFRAIVAVPSCSKEWMTLSIG